jgi:pyruvate kinase
MNHKKIIATIGPSSMNKDTIEKMDKSGVDIFRINMSHTEAKDFKNIFNMVAKWTSKPICPDTEGAQLRTGILVKNEIIIKSSDIIQLGGPEVDQTKNLIPLNIPAPEKLFIVGDLLKIDFDGILIQIIKIDDDVIYAQVLTGGKIISNKGISVDRHIELPAFSKKDIEVIGISNELKVDTIFLSFCSSGESVKTLRKHYDYDINIISKVESQAGLRNIDDICKNSDGILIDRGDLSRDVAIEKIAFAQSFIMGKGISYSTPVYTATNFLESMIENPKPTRAEINDIVSTLSNGGSGIVLAAETAIGKYPVDCVRIVSRIIREFEDPRYFSNGSFNNKSVDYLLSLSLDGIVKPHGNKELVQQTISDSNDYEDINLPSIEINEKNISDLIQIAEGVYSPLTGFMNLEEVNSVLQKNKLRGGENWTLPIILQIDESKIDKIPHSGRVVLIDSKIKKPVGILDIENIEKIEPYEQIIKLWFGTNDPNHPGVKEILKGGAFIVSGKTFLLSKYRQNTKREYEFSPKQTREIFYHNGWYNIVGFHTRNIPHTGHEFIQKQALEISNAEAVLLSPVTGIKKKGDFRSNIIMACYQNMIKSDVYKPYGALLSPFNTYSRYAGPREAVFTAICRKNFGCNYFIVGRDHTGVGGYYAPDASQKIFDEMDLGIEILSFDTASFCPQRNIVTSEFKRPSQDESRIELSATAIREKLKSKKKIPSYLLRPELAEILLKMNEENPSDIFYE